jgi:hypothetical protein
MQIELNYTLTPDDFHEFYRAWPKLSKIPRSIAHFRFYRILLGGLALALVFALALLVFPNKAANPTTPTFPAHIPNSSDAPLSPIGFLFCAFMLVVIWYFLLRARYSKSPVERFFKKNPSIADPVSIVLTNEGVTVHAVPSNELRPWADFNNSKETENLLLLFSTDQGIHLLPKRAFPSPESLAEFRAFAQAHIGNTPIGFPVQPPPTPSSPPTPKNQ